MSVSAYDIVDTHHAEVPLGDDDDDEICCRICLEESDEEEGSHRTSRDLIAPCRCRGTSKWVHRDCLNRWRANNADAIAFSRCTECLFDYHLEASSSRNTLRSMKYWCFVSRDVCFLTVLVQLVIVALAGLVHLFLDDDLVIAQCGASQWWWCSLGLYYTYGVLLFLVGLGIQGAYLLITNDCSFENAMTRLHEGDHNNNSRSSRRRRSSSRPCSHCCIGPDCGDCCTGCYGSCGQLDGSTLNCEACFAMVAIILAVVGFFYAIFLAVYCAQRILQKHLFLLQKRRLVEDFPVKDLSGYDSYCDDMEEENPSSSAVELPPAPELSTEEASNLKKLGLMME